MEDKEARGCMYNFSSLVPRGKGKSMLVLLTYLPDWLVITVDRAEFALVSSRQNLLVEDFGFLVFALLQVAAGQVVFRLGDIRVVGAEFVFIDFQSALVVKLDLLVLALKMAGKVSESFSHNRTSSGSPGFDTAKLNC